MKQNTTWKLRAFIAIIATASILLLCVLVGFQAVPVTGSSDSAYLAQAGLQETRCAAMATNDLILASRPSVEHAQAISDLQVVLPLFQQEQQTLLANQDTDVQWALQQARPDYLAIVRAEQAILLHPESSQNSIQLAIVLAHYRAYLSTMNQLVATLQRLDDERLAHLFEIEAGIVAAQIAIIVCAAFIVNRALRRSDEVAVATQEINEKRE